MTSASRLAIVLLELLTILDVTIQPSGIAAAGAAGGLAIMGPGWIAEMSPHQIGQGGVPVLDRVIGATGLNPSKS